MAKLINKTQGYTIVGQNISMDGRLGMKERGLFLTLLSLPDNWEFSVIGLTKILPDGKAAIQAAVQKLEDLGYLKRVQTKGEKGKFAGYDWEIIPQPSEEAPLTENRSTARKRRKSPLTENRSTEKRSTENPSTENQPQLNTNQSNTKKLNTNSINYPSINHTEEEPKKVPAVQNDRLIDGELIEKIKNQIDYDACVTARPFEREMVDLIVNSLAQLYVANKPMVFSDISYDPQVIHDRAAAFNYDHVGYVIDSFNGQPGEIRNVPRYILVSVFNAPATFQVLEDRAYIGFMVENSNQGGNVELPKVAVGQRTPGEWLNW